MEIMPATTRQIIEQQSASVGTTDRTGADIGLSQGANKGAIPKTGRAVRPQTGQTRTKNNDWEGVDRGPQKPAPRQYGPKKPPTPNLRPDSQKPKAVK